MKTKNIIICIVLGIILVGLLCLGVYSLTPSDNKNNTTEINISINETNNNTTTETVRKTNTQKSSKKSSDDGIYFDEELNTYFDKNDRTVYDGQFAKGTSKSEMKEAFAEIERESNLE